MRLLRLQILVFGFLCAASITLIAQVPAAPVNPVSTKPVEQTTATQPADSGSAKSDAQTNLQQQATDSAQSIAAMQKQVADTRNQLSTLEDQVKQATADSQKLDLLEKQVEALTTLHQAEHNSALATDKNRFIAGKELLVVMTVDLNQLQSGLILAEAFDQVDDLANPMNDMEFSSQINSIISRLNSSNNDSLSQSAPLSALMTNPYLSAAFSLGSLLIPKLQKSAKPNALVDLTCTLSFSSDLGSDAHIIRTDMINLVTSADGLDTEIQRYGENYLAVSGYTTSWKDYMTKRSQGFDPAAPFVSRLFKDTDTKSNTNPDTKPDTDPDTNSDTRSEASAAVATVRSIAGQYQALLVRTDDLYTQAILMLQRHASYQCHNAIYPAAAKLTPIVVMLQKAESAFRSGDLSDAKFVTQLNESN